MEKIELKELGSSTVRQNAIRPFNLTSSGYHVGLLGSASEAIILEMKHSPLAEHTFSYSVETISLPPKPPTTEVVAKFDLASQYRKLDCLKRQYISLDPVYVNEILETPVKCHPVAISWAPEKLFSASTLAVVTTNGSCEIRRRDAISREWNIKVASLTELHSKIFPIKSSSNVAFEDFQEIVENYCTTAISWNMDLSDLRPIFVTGNATGWILFWKISNNDEVSSYCKCKTSDGRISYIYFMKNFVVACFLSGVIKLFKFDDDKLIEVETLCKRNDRLACKKVIMTFSREINKWILVATKAAHVLIFILSKSGKVLQKVVKYLANIEITGFDMVSPLEYIFATITGSIKLVKISLKDGNIQLNEENVLFDFDHTNYQLLGLAASPNKVAWTLIIFHNKPYTQQSQFHASDAIIKICSLSIKDALKLLTDSQYPIDNPIDCAEIIRMEIIKNSTSPKYDNISIDEGGISNNYFKKLQLKLLVLNAGSTYQRLKFNNTKKGQANEIKSLTKLVECVFIYLRLQYIRGLKTHTPFQLLAGKCLKDKLNLLQAELISKEDVLRNVQENFNTLSDCLLTDLGTLFDDANEKCSYCDNTIEFYSMMCSSSHEVPRCYISCIQVPLFTSVCCSSCTRLYLNDIESLKTLFPEDEKIKCTFCGFPLAQQEITDLNIIQT